MAFHPRLVSSLAVVATAVAIASSGFAEAPPAGVLDVHIRVSNTCRTQATPPSYSVSAGSTFTVDWINDADSEYPVNIDKIDRFNTVPIVLGLEPGQSYHDDIRAWCGQYTGTFSFRITSPCDRIYIPVDCNAQRAAASGGGAPAP
ncbi:hypothetical protein LZC95_15055 [Pendulispora brunnea]|uniref:Uncharacterized protein n=1 Tax=Pendulispora brunnea TaxID=2905690 RepID=A0ABZ2KJB7_9BACT